MQPAGRSSLLARGGIVLMVVGVLLLLVTAIDLGGSDGAPDDITSTAAPSPVESDTRPTDAASSTDVIDPVVGVQPEGFTTVQARITDADGEVCEVCLWLADDSDERGRGLMGVTDLGDADGMLFRFEEEVGNSFFMLNTPTPLSIAWFDDGGEFVDATDMEPCLEVPDGGCPLYSPGSPYQLALEVFQGGLADLGVGPGARLDIIEGSEADECPATP